MRGRLLFLGLVLALFNVQAVAQFGLIVQHPPNANVAAIAEHAGGAVVGCITEANQCLLSVPATAHLSDSEVNWKEWNQGTTLPSSPHALYLHVTPTTVADWYKTQPSFVLIHLAEALTHSRGRGVVVADINCQVDYSHPALIGHLTSGNDFVVGRRGDVAVLNDSSASYLDDSSASYLDDSSASYLDDSSASYLDDSSASYLDSQNPCFSHGTLVAGSIAAVAPDAMIMPLRAFDDNGSSNCFTIARAIRYAVNNGAQVINMSFGMETACSAIRTAIEYGQARNVTFTASAGNNNSSAPQFPAAYSGVIATAATNLLDVKAGFSNYGTVIDVDAPGVNMILPVPGNRYGIVNGTSFSAPIIAGCAALVLAEGVTGVASRIAGSTINIDAKNPSYAGQLGPGRIDILKCVNPQ